MKLSLTALIGICLLVIMGCDVASSAPAEKTVSDLPVEKSTGLVFDPVALDMGTVLEGEKASATLLIRNNGQDFSQIVKVESSCGCTTAEPETRMLAPGAFTLLHIEVDTLAKRGDIRKSITMTDQNGVQSIAWLSLHVKENPHALGEKRSIFDGKCASCHAEPAKGKTLGLEIYTAVCVMCHGVAAKGGYAPSLRGLDDVDVLRNLIANGTGTQHMPAFSKKEGGPLTHKQISRLVKWIISLDE
ncbi:MAG: DUF1573 domain-containing protein [Mariprofundaceae bacterium]|nr:DUF1573 domain-containing protein [Mariprofundaceae bacterium]